ncbi:glycoside hydrolase family 125 protein [Oleiagrimonas soli]|uniref:Tat pathway signal protein n=1 Tax=Oleiagrimonas soli TaxID=1543381 RepID=A0A099CZK8_9GAMM|nr:glycoside hydrolase family 125 protein [Oleiagrimonas soli]KGI79111.1 Tat pathway signal protein [Oleiagrimonas soli]MBB6184667.1 hypothetical protein [Oleiagrimonas soli]
MTDRRDFLRLLGTATASGLFAGSLPRVARAAAASYPNRRPPPSARRFRSAAVERTLKRVKAGIGDPKLAALFENCYPNTLDTTVFTGTLDGKPDTFVITGDIDAMWLRDSSAQVHPYLSLAREDADLRRLFRGLIHRQARCIRLDPYANAFLRDADAKPLSWAVHDTPALKHGVGERKWEIDSLCYPIRLAHGYWRATGDATPFDDDWRAAMHQVLDTFRQQQRLHGPGPYRYHRPSDRASESVPRDGLGAPTRPNGMIHAAFRPSDDACVYPLNVPGNLFAAVALRQLAMMSRSLHRDTAFADDCEAMAKQVETATHRDGRIGDAHGHGTWAYEIDGRGHQLFMDDANVPSLLGLSYLGVCRRDDPLYRRTRAKVWSAANPYFFHGRAAEGIGGPHEGPRMIWPMAIVMRALTSEDDAEIRQCLRWLRDTDAGTGFMHEAFDQDDPKHFTRAWFAWANTLFGELIVELHRHRPQLLRT